MRVLRFLFLSAVLVGVGAVILGLLAREMLLVWGVSVVRSNMSSVRTIAANPQKYSSECLQKGAQPDENLSLIDSLQLRFVSDTEFVVEVVCRQFRLDPIRVTEGTLPPFVQKTAGSSGLFWGEASSAVELNALGRKRTVLVENRKLFYDQPGIVRLGEGPTTVCAGYGFECCAAETAQGIGDQLSGVTDCPRTCFSQCVSRPVVLSFSSDPYVDLQTRVAEATAGQAVTFSYVADFADAVDPVVTIEFGDGQREQLTADTGSASHTYTCTQDVCEYPVAISITDAEGRTSAELPVTKITLRVLP